MRNPWRTLALCSLFLTTEALSQNKPLLPQAYVNTTMPTVSGQKIVVPNGGNLQAALNSAQCGDTIALAPGAVFTGNFRLPLKSCSGWTILRTDIPNSALPPEGQRMTPALAATANLATIASPNVSPALDTATSAHHYRIIGIKFEERSTGKAGYLVNGVPANLNYKLISLGSGLETLASETPDSIVLDRVYITARPTTHIKRGVEFNGRNLALIDSWVEQMKGSGQDTQAVSGYNAPGPIKITNNYLEGAGENIIFGGGDPSIPNLITKDIEIRGNYLFKPLSWQTPFSNGAGTLQWTVKNSFEMKNGERVLFEGNYLENCWADAQTGLAIVIKSANQSGGCTWCTTRDVLLRYNILERAAGGTNNLSSSAPPQDVPMVRIRYEHNLFKKINDPTMGKEEMVQIVGSAYPLHDISFEHYTFIFAQETANLLVADQAQSSGFVFMNNVGSKGSWGMRRSGSGEGTVAFDLAFSTPYTVTGNVIARANSKLYPAGNYFPATMANVGFVDLANEDFTLAPSSPYKGKATDGTDPGADFTTLTRYTQGARSGIWPNGLPPTPPVGTVDTVAPGAPSNLSVSGG